MLSVGSVVSIGRSELAERDKTIADLQTELEKLEPIVDGLGGAALLNRMNEMEPNVFTRTIKRSLCAEHPQLDTSMIWGVEDSTVLGLAGIIAGLVTALTSFWWNYKTRALGHREFLYQKQIEAYVDLSTNVSRSLHPCYNFLFTKALTPENRKEFGEITEKAYDELWGQERLSLMILPLGVAEALTKLMLVLTRELPKLDNSKQAGLALSKAEMAVYIAVRKWAGIEPLTKEMLQAFGEHP